jgi:hypothetical protein
MKNLPQTLFPGDYYPIHLGWLKAAPSFILWVVIVYAWIVALKLMPHITIRFVIKGSATTIILLAIMNLLIYEIYAGDWKFLWHYLRRNIIGYKMWVYKPDAWTPISRIMPHSARLRDVMKQPDLVGHQFGKGWMVSYRLGGWFGRSGQVVHWNNGTDIAYGKVRVQHLPGLDPLGHRLLVSDKWGSRKDPRVARSITVRNLFDSMDKFVGNGGIKWRMISADGQSA